MLIKKIQYKNKKKENKKSKFYYKIQIFRKIILLMSDEN